MQTYITSIQNTFVNELTSVLATIGSFLKRGYGRLVESRQRSANAKIAEYLAMTEYRQYSALTIYHALNTNTLDKLR